VHVHARASACDRTVGGPTGTRRLGRAHNAYEVQLFLTVFGQLSPGATLERAQAELSAFGIFHRSTNDRFRKRPVRVYDTTSRAMSRSKSAVRCVRMPNSTFK
jgi:hypothetical protein